MLDIFFINVGHAVELLDQFVETWCGFDAGAGGDAARRLWRSPFGGIACARRGSHRVDRFVRELLLGVTVSQISSGAHAPLLMNFLQQSPVAHFAQSVFLKSSSVKLALLQASLLFWPSPSWSNCCCTCSANVTPSRPCPGFAGHAVGMNSSAIRDARPVPTNLIGTPVTALTDSAAAAAASPSSFVMISAVELERFVERLRTEDGVLAGHRVDHQID